MQKEGKKRHGFIRITVRTLMIAAAIPLLLSYLSVFVNPAKLWLMAVFGIAYLPLLLFNAVLLIVALVKRSRSAWIPAVVLLPSLLLFSTHFQFGGAAASPSDSDIKIVTYNVGRFSTGQSRSACRDSVFRFLDKQDADIICLQEVWVKRGEDVRSVFRKYFKDYKLEYFVYQHKSSQVGNATLSRFKTIGKGKIEFEGKSNMALYSDYDIGGDTIRIYNCHFQSYNISLASIGADLRANTSGTVNDTEGKMQTSLRLRSRQVDTVIRNIQACPVDAFVAGDFNDTPMSYTYWRLSRGRRDSFRDAGSGFGATYSMLKPLLRIDYLLCPYSLVGTSHKVVKVDYSDHYPVVATFAKAKKH